MSSIPKKLADSSPHEPHYLIIGRVLKPWGFRGELKIEILTDFPERFASLSKVFLGEDAKPFSVERARLHGGRAAIIKLQGVDTPEDGAKWREALVQVERSEAVPLPEGQVYLYQVLGLLVKTTQGETLGKIVEVLDTSANDVYVVQSSTGEILIPAIPSVIKQTDLERGEMIIEPMEGLL